MQMLVVYALALLIPLVVLGGVFLTYARQILHEHYLELVEADNRRARTLLSAVADQTYAISDQVCFQSDVKSVLKTEYASVRDQISDVNMITELDDLEYDNDQIEGIYIYTDNPTLKDYKQFCTVDDQIRQEQWYQLASKDVRGFWTSIMAESYTSVKHNLCLVRQISLLDTPYHAVLVIRISDAYLRSIIASGTNLDIVGLEGEGIVYASRPEWYASALPVQVDPQQTYYRHNGIAQIREKPYFTSVSTIQADKTNSRFYVCTMNSEGFAVADNVMRSSLLILLPAILVPFIILVLFAGHFSRRVGMLRSAMRKAKSQDHNMAPTFRGNDEITETYEDLVALVQDIKEKDAKMLQFELREAELRSRQEIMDYKVLASQINPHYLYNALETIRMKALTGGDREVADAIKILGRTLHYVMENTGTAYTTLDKELQHVSNYLAIQKLRFGDRINYALELSPELEPREYAMLPLLLQPVVENAVIHGLESLEGRGDIRVVVQHQNGKLCIRVCDSGKGISAQELAQLRLALDGPDNKAGSGIALRNIHRRIRLSCGEDYGLRLESELDVGTRVTLELPADHTAQM